MIFDLVNFFRVRHKLAAIEAEMSASIGSDFSLKEDSDYPFRPEQLSAWQALKYDYKLYQFLKKKGKEV